MSRYARAIEVCGWILWLALLLSPAPCFARPGGGMTFGGGGFHSSGGGGFHSYGGGYTSFGGYHGGSGDPIVILFVVAIGIAWFVIVLAGSTSQEWQTSRSGPTDEERAARAEERRRSLRDQRAALKQLDPAFSLIAFQDDASGLYASAHEARGTRTLDRLATRIDESARETLANLSGATSVKGIVIGAMQVTQIDLQPEESNTSARIVVRFTSNYTEYEGGLEHTYFVEERWHFTRRYASSDPNAPYRDSGEADDEIWRVLRIEPLARDGRGSQLVGTVPEQGTDLPTIIDPEASARWDALEAKDPALNLDALKARVSTVFRELQKAWADNQWKYSRGMLTDSQYQSMRYWQQMYAAQKLRNVTENARITEQQLACVDGDPQFDAVTLRIWATGLDYTSDAEMNVVAGSRTTERPYSEYWTFIRATDARGRPRADTACPHCEADAAVDVTGSCTACHMKLSGGAYDWVLSRIEQDETYEG